MDRKQLETLIAQADQAADIRSDIQHRVQLKKDLKRVTAERKVSSDSEQKAHLSKQIKQLKSHLREVEQAIWDQLDQAPLSNQQPPRPDYHEPFTVVPECSNGWSKFTAQHRSTVYHDQRWLDLLRDAMGRETIGLEARDSNGEVIGVMPVAITRSKLFGNYAVSLPYLNYGSACAIAPNVERALIDYAFKQTDEWAVDRVELRDTVYREGYAVRSDKVSMQLDLSQLTDQHALFNMVGSKVRAQAKKALTSGISFRSGGTALLNDFYAVFAQNMRDLGTPVYGVNWFSAILETFSPETLLTVGYYNGKPVSAAFLIQHHKRWEIPWASTLRRVNSIAANMALYATVLTEVIERGGLTFDFGRSSVDAPTYRFKKQWRAEPKPLYWYYSKLEGMSELTTSNPKYQLAIGAWQRMPVWATKLIGPAIVKNLP